MRACGNCKFADLDPKPSEHLIKVYCRRYPPKQWEQGAKALEFPEVLPLSWCGEFDRGTEDYHDLLEFVKKAKKMK